MRKGHPTVISILLAAALLAMASPVHAADNTAVATVHVVGRSRIQGADMSASQKAAVADSLVTAVTVVLTERVPPRTAVGNFQAISEAVLANTDQFVMDYKVLTESVVAKEHRVLVKVNVSLARLTKVLNSAGIPLSQKQYPRILFCIAEQWAGDPGYRYWWAEQPVELYPPAAEPLSAVFKKQGFPSVLPNGRPAGTLSPELRPGDAVDLGRQFGADVVVAGQAVVQEAPNTMGAALRSFNASLAARAYSVGSGREIAQVQRTFVATAEDPVRGSQASIGKAAQLAGADLAKQVSRAWFAEGAGASKVEIYIEGISGNVASFVRFRGALSNMTGVDRVQLREMQQDAAVLAVAYQGNVKALAEAMLQQQFDTFSLNVFEVGQDLIRLQLVPRATP